MIELIQSFTASVFWFLVVVGILVFLHEAGHFLTARYFGMRIEVFSLGFGKRLFGRRRGDTDYRVSLIPLGGYVKLAGGEEAADEQVPLPPDYFLSRPRWQRFLVLVMGATVNLLLAVSLFSVSYMIGVEVPMASPAIVQVIDPGSPADLAGLRAGDRIQEVNGRKVSQWEDIHNGLIRSGARALLLKVKRADGTLAELSVTPRFDTSGIPLIGARGGTPAIVTNVEPDMPAARVGLREDDRIEAVDGRRVVDLTEVANTIHGSVGKELVLTVRRGSGSFDVRVTPVQSTLPDGRPAGRIGFGFKMPVEMVKLAPLPAVRRGLETSVELAGSLFHVLKNLITHNQPLSTLSGPIEIARLSRRSAEQGVQLLTWMAFISLQLGILNLLPIPVLDGGHIFIVFTEAILRRDLSARLKERLNQAGFVMLLLLMAVVLFQDIRKNI